MKSVMATVGVLSVSLMAVGLALVFTNHQSAVVSERSSAEISEGIPVHGDWVIEVRNPDGTLANRVEFSNHLYGFGAMSILNLLARKAVAGHWEITLMSKYKPNDGAAGYSYSPGLCNQYSLDGINKGKDYGKCTITEPGGSGYHSNNLTLTVEGSSNVSTPNGTLTFTGSVTADEDGYVGTAKIYAEHCFTSQITPDDCYAGIGKDTPDSYNSDWGEFSRAEFDEQKVAKGQLINVSIVYTFGSKIQGSHNTASAD